MNSRCKAPASTGFFSSSDMRLAVSRKVVLDIQGVAREVAGYIKRLSMVEQLHLLHRHTTNLFSQPRRLWQCRGGTTGVEPADAVPDNAPEMVLLVLWDHVRRFHIT